MARIEDIERRLQNWARWKLGSGSGGLGFKGSMLGAHAAAGGYREAIVPTNDHEAALTDRAVATLDDRLRSTVEQVYLTGDSPELDARLLGVSTMAVTTRIWQAQRHVQSWLSGHALDIRNERERVDRLQRGFTEFG